MHRSKIRILSYVVIAYMLLAFIWWSILLYTKNKDAFQAKVEYWKLISAAEGGADSNRDFYQTDVYQNLVKEYKRQEWMIFSEAAVFVISLLIGLWLINRGFIKELEAAQQRRNFLLSITHELKSPIASIKLILETFLKRDLKKEQSQQLSANALTETDRLNTLVNDLLLAARMETTYQPNIELVHLPDLIHEILTKLRAKYPKASFTITKSEDISEMDADKLGITSIALNLLENAVKYSPQAANIEVKIQQANGTIHWETTDNGLGISDKEKKLVFNRFYRIGNEDTRKTKGTGLGLYIVEQIVKAHQGTIKILDNQPKGSIFKITLPVHQPKANI